MMFRRIVKASEVQERLVPTFYEPERAALESQVRHLGLPCASLGELAEEGTSITYGIVQPGDFVRPRTGVRLIRCVDIDSLTVAIDAVLWVSHEISRPCLRSEVKPNDILIGIAGTLACIGLAPAGIEPANLNQSVARLRVGKKTGVPPHWVAAFLSSRFGQGILLRRSVGSVQQHLNLADLPDVPILLPDPQVRAYIGDKVRQAERLRERASRSLRFATRVVELLIDGELNEVDVRDGRVDLAREVSTRPHEQMSRPKHSRTLSADLTDRIDASYYKPDLVAACKTIEKSGDCKTLAEVIDGDRDVKSGATPFGAEYLTSGAVRFFRTSDVWGLAVHTADTVFITAEQDQDLARSRLADGDVLLTITGADFGHAGAIMRSHLPANISQHSVRFRPTIDESYLVAYLESRYGQQVIWRQAYGATRPAIDFPGVKGLLVRVPDPAVQKIIGDAVRSGVKARDFAQSLTAAAKILVEALIEKGQDFESELRDVQEALLRGDYGPDRAILERLTRNGIDVENEPKLFPNLNDLYAALDESSDASVTVEVHG